MGDEAIVDVVSLSDEDIDRHLDGLCKAKNSTHRAVETSELMLKTVTNLPATNTFAVPIIGTCPNCAGDEDEYDVLTGALIGTAHASGHARVCWDPGATLDTASRRTDCGTATKKAVL